MCPVVGRVPAAVGDDLRPARPLLPDGPPHRPGLPLLRPQEHQGVRARRGARHHPQPGQ